MFSLSHKYAKFIFMNIDETQNQTDQMTSDNTPAMPECTNAGLRSAIRTLKQTEDCSTE